MATLSYAENDVYQIHKENKEIKVKKNIKIHIARLNGIYGCILPQAC